MAGGTQGKRMTTKSKTGTVITMMMMMRTIIMMMRIMEMMMMSVFRLSQPRATQAQWTSSPQVKHSGLVTHRNSDDHEDDDDIDDDH